VASIILGLFSSLLWVVFLALPAGLNALGLHPNFEIRNHHLKGHKALIITTSQNILAPSDSATGVWASEMTAPYYVFRESGLEVDLASIQGGEIPIEPGSTDWPLASQFDQTFLADPIFKTKIKHSHGISELDFSSYDMIFLAGGWGAAYDLGQSEILGLKLSEAYAQGTIIGAVCHGPLGLLKVLKPDGSHLVKGLHLTAVSDKQLAELMIGFTPQHPEHALREAGALYESQTQILDVLATHVVVDGRIITGQNQNAGAEVADRMLLMLSQSALKN
jgi:putative intracellular protease/amidase